MQKLYDFDKAKKYIKANRDQILEVSVGMYEDWFWTADTVYKDGRFQRNLNSHTIVNGVKGSCWATPVMRVDYNDGTEAIIEISSGENDPYASNPGWTTGCLSGPVQDAMPPITKII